MRNLFLFVTTFAFFFQTHAQHAKGSWQDYLSYTNAKKIAVASDKIYCATEGGLLFYDLQDNSVNKFSGLNQLSEFGIKTIAYSDENKVLVIAYDNSNVDLVFESGVINLPDIKRKQLTGDKTINNISFIGNEAYLSCGFGIVVLNLQKREVKDTYFIGEEGTVLCVNDVEADANFLYAATNEGILKADINSSNLLDYQNWNKIENIPHANDKFSQIEIHTGNIIANYTPDEYGQDAMYILNGNDWSAYLPGIRYAYDIQTNGEYMTVCSRSEVFVIDKNHSIIGKLNYYQLDDERISPINPRSAGISNDGALWIADYDNSLVKVSGENFESISPSGPLDNNMFSLLANGSELWITAGGRSAGWNNTWQTPRFQHFGAGEWTYFNKSTFPEMDGFFDVVNFAVDPSDASHIFVGSWGGGMLEFRNDEFIQRFTNNNSSLQSAVPQQPNEPYVRIGGLDFDSEGNLWITNSEVSQNLHKYSSQGEWESFTLPEIANNKSIGEVIVTQKDDKWILVPRGNDAYVIDKTGERKKKLLVTSYFNNGVVENFTRMNDIYSIVEDNEGAIWIGTSVGVAVYNNPSRIWDTDVFYASQPGLDLNDGVYHPLLKTETVTAIAVDGANRKWLGTKTSGVYLISENGEKEIQHFTKENSSLLSNTITAIAINQKTGEIFFGTDKGLISYQGDATEGKDVYENVYVYPNPVRETYDGPVTVTGLIENTDVKITDISGNLVFNTTSLGGQAVWDGKNLNGNRVKTGVYLVFCNDEKGEETHITKLLFIN
ncbi:MAG: T9SS type A sorting domain-containing protein [Bacteroidetes bacterium]|nr:T9SS type A sorting domain-containing protein [Bacteroidota bacterium]